MDTPKPTTPNAESQEGGKKQRRESDNRNEHLTHRPFEENDGLQALRRHLILQQRDNRQNNLGE